jgi:hypothetical protein
MLTRSCALPWRPALSGSPEPSDSAALEARRREIEALLEEIRAETPSAGCSRPDAGTAGDRTVTDGRREMEANIAHTIW